MFSHPIAPAVAKRFRDEHQKKEARKHYNPSANVSRVQEQHGPNQHTPEELLFAGTPNLNVEPEKNPPNASSKRQF